MKTSSEGADRWCSTTTGKLVAHDGPADEIMLAFGKHCGRALSEVPASYLGWMLSPGGRAFLPENLLRLVAEERELRLVADEAAATPANLTMADVLGWAMTAPAGDVADVRRLLGNLLTNRASKVCAGLHYPEDTEAARP